MDKFKLNKKQPSDLSNLPTLNPKPNNAPVPNIPGITETKSNDQASPNTSTLPDINPPMKNAKIQLNSKNEIVTCNMNNIIKYEEYCNLKTVKVFNF